MNHEKICDELIDYVTQISNADIQKDTPLLGQGIVDSFNVLQIVAFIEEHFRVVVDPEELPIEGFHSVETLANWIQGLEKEEIFSLDADFNGNKQRN